MKQSEIIDGIEETKKTTWAKYSNENDVHTSRRDEKYTSPFSTNQGV